MAQSLCKLNLHIVFSTKNRAPFLTEGLDCRVHGYLSVLCKDLGSFVHKIGGDEEHVHIACTLPKSLSVSSFLEEIKKRSSKWVKLNSTNCPMFGWQNGYAAFSVGESSMGRLIRYIETQKQHHKKMNYKREVLKFLEKYRVDYNEKYLWN